MDFSHASESHSPKEKALEIKELSHILGITMPTKSAAKDIEKPVLRRSLQIKESEQKVKVQTKDVQVKYGKATC